MQSNHDFEMALKLQQAFDTEYRIENPSIDLTYNDKKKKSNLNNSRSKGLIDPSWELVDPTPNIHVLFVQFNEKFFWNKLLPVTVSWSKRMTVCAGICSYQGRGGLCAITLSEPLLKLRPRKDLIETLLHEMIHAYLFLDNNDRDRDGHGPNFHKHMYRINNEAGTNISVYHNFHDEVRLYQQHWWRCDGPCQKRPPFFGMVRRSMNRAPGPNDRWWAEHQKNCNGNFIKVKEPEKPEKTKSTKKAVPGSPKKKPTNLPDIRNFLPVVKTPKANIPNNENKENIHTINDSKPGFGLGTKNKNGTVVLNPKTGKNKGNDPSIASVIPSSSNIKGFSNSEPINGKSNVEAFSGTGRKLSNSTCNSNPLEAVRNHWAEKFIKPIEKQNTPKRKSPNTETEIMKKSRIDAISSEISCPNCNKNFTESEINSHLDKCLNADVSILSEFSDDQEINQFNDDLVKLIECPVCNTMVEEDQLNSHLDECLNKPSTSSNINDDKKLCEICEKYIFSAEFDAHVLECLTKCYDNNDDVLNSTTNSLNVSCLVCNKDIVKEDLNLHLEDCMVSVFDKNNIDDEDDNSNSSNENEIDGGSNENNDKKYNCPICMSEIDEINMNRHIDECLNTVALKNEVFD